MWRAPTQTLLVLAALHSGAALAGSVSFTSTITVRVTGTCEVASLTESALTLHCTRDFRPADPHALPELTGQLPAAPATWVASRAAPSGGTFNDYVISSSASSGDQPGTTFHRTHEGQLHPGHASSGPG